MGKRTRHPNSSHTLHENDHNRASSNRPQSVVSQQLIKKLWSKLQESCQIFCRAIGLNVLVSSVKFLRHPWGKGFEETTKTAIRKSQPVALLRAMIHVIPVGVALWEVTLNWNTYYVGSFLLKQVYYQTAAKAHEIMIQASLATAIFSYIRYQLVLAKGIPFGALFSGLQINQISYLWSIEFWGSVSSNHLSLWRKLIMLVFISLCFVLAAVAGPSSAILLIPRLSYWRAGSTHIWLNATLNDIWPNRLNGSSVPRHCAVMETGSLSNECPSSEWEFLQTWMSLTKNSIPIGFQNKSDVLRRVVVTPASIQLTGKTSTRQYKENENRYLISLTGNLSSSFEATAAETTTQHATIADALASISSIWDSTVADGGIGTQHGASYHDNQIVVHTIAADYYQPYSSVFCVRDAIQGPKDQRTMAFPIVPGFDFDYKPQPGLLSIVNTSISGIPAVEAPSIRRAQLLELPGTESDNRVKWVQLPQSPLTGVSVGFVVLLPRNPSDLSKRATTAIQSNTDIVVCSIAAGWGASSINITSFQHSNSPTSSLVKFDISSVTLNDSTPDFNRFQTRTNLPVFFSQPLFPSIPIEIDVEWAEFLNPYVPSANTTVIDFLLKHSARNGSKAGVPEAATRNIITGLMTNGLARSGFTSELQGNIKLIKEKEDTLKFGGPGNGSLGEVPDGNLWVSGKSDLFTVDPEESKNWVKLRVDSTMQGYAYNIEGPAPKLAIAFLLTYCCFALSHCFYSGISGISSTCWDSISEVTALAINSSPTTILRNTCAGIAEIRIFRTPVRILTRSDEEGEGEHLELVFGEIDPEDSQKRAIKPNRTYGTMLTAQGDAGPAKKECRSRKGRHPRKRMNFQA